MLCHNLGDKALEIGSILSQVGKASAWEPVMLITGIKVSIEKRDCTRKGYIETTGIHYLPIAIEVDPI